MPNGRLLDPDGEALRAVVRALCNNCIVRGTTAREGVEAAVEDYADRYPGLTADLVRGAIFLAEGGMGASVPTPDVAGEEGAAVEPPPKEGEVDGADRPSDKAVGNGRIRETPGGKERDGDGDDGLDKIRERPEDTERNDENDLDGAKAPRKRKNYKRGKRTRWTCRHEGCDKWAQSMGFCISHGGSRRLCKREGCANPARGQGLCASHGGVTPPSRRRRGSRAGPCLREGCTNFRKRGGYCWAHGEQEMCLAWECANQARRGGACGRHYCARHGNACKLGGCDLAASIAEAARRSAGEDDGGASPPEVCVPVEKASSPSI